MGIFKRQDIDQANAEVARLTGELANKDTEIETLKSSVTEKDTEIETLKSSVTEKDTEIEKLKTDLNAESAEVEKLKTEVETEKSRSASRSREALASSGQPASVLTGESSTGEKTNWKEAYLNEQDPVKKSALWRDHEKDILT